MVVLVLGTGRSGTSTVARILHTQMGVHMGDNLKAADQWNPDGYFEDRDFMPLNDAFLTNWMTYATFNGHIARLIEARNAAHANWGIKDPALSCLLGFYLSHLSRPLIVHCHRNEDAVVASIIKCYGWSEDAAIAMVRTRMNAIENYKTSVSMVEIDFTEHVSDDEVGQVLEDALAPCRMSCGRS